MSKSNGEFLTLGVLQEKGYDPMDYRYFCLGGHYRSQLKFSYTSLDGAREARNGVVSRIRDLLDQGAKAGSLQSEAAKAAKAEFAEHITNDLNSPRALADLWGTLKNDNLTPDERYSLALDYDRVLGLELASVGKSQEKAPIVDEKALLLLSARTKAKEMKDWGTADRIRAELDTMGYEVKDTSQGPVLVRKQL